MKFITDTPFNNTLVDLESGYRKTYIPFKPEHTVNLLHLTTIKGEEGKGVKKLVCPFCGEVLTVKMHTAYGSYENRTDDSYHFDSEIDHTCDALVQLEKQINEAQKIEKQIGDIKVTKLMPLETKLSKMNKGIKQLTIARTAMIVSNGQIFKRL